MHRATTTTMATNVPADLVSVGHITGAYGVQGWVRIYPYSADAGALLQVKTWWLGVRDQKRDQKAVAGTEALIDVRDVERLEAKLHGGDVVAHIMGIVGRDAAQALKGSVVQIQRSHFPVLSDNEFYWLDLIGLAVENCQGESLGVVADLIDHGAHPILRVVPSDENDPTISSTVREYLIPFVERFVPTVDQKNKKIIVDWGLDY